MQSCIKPQPPLARHCLWALVMLAWQPVHGPPCRNTSKELFNMQNFGYSMEAQAPVMEWTYRVESRHVVSEKALSPVARFIFFHSGSQHSMQHAFAACWIALFVILQWRDNAKHDRRRSSVYLRKRSPQYVRVLFTSSTSDTRNISVHNPPSLKHQVLSLSLDR